MPGKFILVCSLVLLCFQIGSSTPKAADQCQMIKEVLRVVGDLKAGDSRAHLEETFKLDGGMQFQMHSRYSFKRCPFIKVNVEFSTTNEIKQPEESFPSHDKIVAISKPYLDYPTTD